jgi:hypothetical protein
MSKKTLCDWTKNDIEKHFNKLSKIVETPQFICKKCARSSNSEEYLCKPRIKKPALK